MQPLKADTQVVVMLGPAVDSTDGVTLESGLVAAMDAASGIRISKNGGAWADRAATVVATVYDEGFYRVTLKTGDVDTEGTLDVMYEDAATCLPMLARFQVVNANVYDSLFAAATTDYLQVDQSQILGTALTEASAGNIAGNQSVFWDNDDTVGGGEFLSRIEDTYTVVNNIPTVTAFEARTLPSADYVVVTDTIAGVTLVGTCTTNTDMRGTDGAFDDAAQIDEIQSVANAILVDTNELQVNQGQWLTATGFSTHDAAAVLTAFGTGADLTACATATGFSTHSAANVASVILATPANLLDTNGSGEVTTSNPAAGGGSAHTASDVAALILETPANLLATNATGQVETSNASGGSGSTSTVGGAFNGSGPNIKFSGVYEIATGNLMTAPTFVAGDVKISIDGGAFTNTTNLPTIVASGSPVLELILTEDEYVAGAIVQIVDQDSVWIGPTFYDLTGGGATETNQNEIKALLAAGPISPRSNRPAAGTIELTRSVDHVVGSPAGAIDLPIDSSTDLTGWTFAFNVSRDGVVLFTKTPTVSDAGGANQKLVTEVDGSDTATLGLGALYEYEYVGTKAGVGDWKPEWGTLDLGGDVRT